MEFEVGKTYMNTECYGSGYDEWTNYIEYKIVKKNDTTIWYEHGLDENEYGEYYDKVHRAKLTRNMAGDECFNLVITRPGAYMIDGSRLKNNRSYFANAKYDSIAS